MRLKLIFISFVVAGVALISYGLGLWPQDGFDRSTFRGSVNAIQKDNDFDRSEAQPAYFQEVVSRLKARLAQPLIAAPNPHDHTILKSVVRQNYEHMKNCFNATETEAQIQCAGVAFDDYYEYKNNVETNFIYELKLHTKDLQSNSHALVYDDQILAHEILLNQSRADMHMAALDLLKLFPPSSENLQVLEVSLATNTDSATLQKGFEILELYKDVPNFDQTFDNIVEEQIRLGMGAETLKVTTRALLGAMNANRYRYYVQIYDELTQIENKNREQADEQLVAKGPNLALNAKLRSLASVLQEYRSNTRESE